MSTSKLVGIIIGVCLFGELLADESRHLLLYEPRSFLVRSRAIFDYIPRRKDKWKQTKFEAPKKNRPLLLEIIRSKMKEHKENLKKMSTSNDNEHSMDLRNKTDIRTTLDNRTALDEQDIIPDSIRVQDDKRRDDVQDFASIKPQQSEENLQLSQGVEAERTIKHEFEFLHDSDDGGIILERVTPNPDQDQDNIESESSDHSGHELTYLAAGSGEMSDKSKSDVQKVKTMTEETKVDEYLKLSDTAQPFLSVNTSMNTSLGRNNTWNDDELWPDSTPLYSDDEDSGDTSENEENEQNLEGVVIVKTENFNEFDSFSKEPQKKRPDQAKVNITLEEDFEVTEFDDFQINAIILSDDIVNLT